MRTSVRELEPGATWQRDGYRVVYPTTRSAVRGAVLDDADVFVLDADQIDTVAMPIRWVRTMRPAAVIGAAGGVPADVSDLVDAALDRPVDRSTVATLTDRARDRRAYLRALEDYEQAVISDDGERAIETARITADELTVDLDPSDRRAVLDAIGG